METAAPGPGGPDPSEASQPEPTAFWQQQLSVAVAALDAQHQHIFRLLARCRADAFGGPPWAQLFDGVDELLDYLQMHFGGEELLMRTFGYPDTFSHQQEHHRLIRVLVEFREQLADGNDNLALPFLDYLEGWMVRHILECDRRYSAFFAERGAIP